MALARLAWHSGDTSALMDTLRNRQVDSSNAIPQLIATVLIITKIRVPGIVSGTRRFRREAERRV